MTTSRFNVGSLDPSGGADGQVPVISGGKFVIGDAPGSSHTLLSPDAQITAVKSTSNPTLNETGAEPENIVKVGDVYWLVYSSVDAAYSYARVHLASAASPAGPWTPYAGNPILTAGGQAWETADQINGACIVEDGGTFYLFYAVAGSAGKTAGIGVATATSITGPYTKYASNPVLSPGASGAWDSLRVQEPSVIFDGTTWVMAYMGEDSASPQGTTEKVGVATASSPLGPWTKAAENPVIGFGAAGGFDAGGAADPSLLFESGVYYCLYSGLATGGSFPWQIGLASANSPAGPWTRSASNPIVSIGVAGTFDDVSAWRGAIFRDGGTYHLPYGGIPDSTLGPSAAKGGNATLTITGGATEQYLTQAAADARYVRTVNGVAPDASGDVTAAGGGAPTTALIPLTTVVGGVPELVWEADDSLALTEVPL